MSLNCNEGAVEVGDEEAILEIEFIPVGCLGKLDGLERLVHGNRRKEVV
jgi:hypothetical protein